MPTSYGYFEPRVGVAWQPHSLPRTAIRAGFGEYYLRDATAVLEGGANVVAEALASATPVIASHIPGNIGMLGRDYEGYFPVGDDAALAALLERASREARFLARLRAQCARRARLFSPARERREVVRLRVAGNVGVACGINRNASGDTDGATAQKSGIHQRRAGGV